MGALMFSMILSWFTSSGALGRIFQTIDNAVDNETTREQIKAQVAQSYMSAQVSLLTGRGWWFPLFFLIPAGVWFTSVVVYSMFFCKACVLPYAGLSYPWTIAALPHPLDEWMGAIVGSLFIATGAADTIARLKK
jgi:hypothetical protein